jgi:hypothetical protein
MKLSYQEFTIEEKIIAWLWAGIWVIIVASGVI